MEQEKETKWKKVLYLDQNVPDNYVDETFMNELKKNLNIKPYDYWTVVKESTVIIQQICSICIFVVSFVLLDEAFISPHSLFYLTMATSSLGYIIKRLFFCTYAPYSRTTGEDLKTVCIFLGFGFCLSAILMTLTQTISTDTIYAMAVLMFITNLLFHDYGSKAAIVSQPVSLNSAIFASVCLASRLPTEWHSFAVITFAFEMFALWPIFRANIKSQFPMNVYVMVTAIITCISFLLLLSISTIAACFFVLVFVFITFICPELLVHMQSYKNNLHGPWDEASIKPH